MKKVERIGEVAQKSIESRRILRHITSQERVDDDDRGEK